MNADEQIMVCTNEQGFHGMVRIDRTAFISVRQEGSA